MEAKEYRGGFVHGKPDRPRTSLPEISLPINGSVAECIRQQAELAKKVADETSRGLSTQPQLNNRPLTASRLPKLPRIGY